MTPADWLQIAHIYAAGIATGNATGNATFETEPPTWPDFDTRHRPDLRFVAYDKDNLAGWVAAISISDRCCYAGVTEHSVDVHPDRRAQGVGRVLMDNLIQEATAAGIWTMLCTKYAVFASWAAENESVNSTAPGATYCSSNEGQRSASRAISTR
jgi:phosphinothricin acetyltransferase